MSQSPLLNRFFHAKLTEGVFTSLLLVLLTMLVTLLVPVVEVVVGRPGLMIFSIILLSFSMLLLDRALNNRPSEKNSTRCGMIGGLLTWKTIEISHMVGIQGLTSETSVITFLLIILICAVLWRNYLPSGGRFYVMVVISSWGLQLLFSGLQFLVSTQPAWHGIYPVLGISAVVVSIISAGWIFFRSQTTNQRLWAALIIFQCLLVAANVFRSGLFWQ